MVVEARHRGSIELLELLVRDRVEGGPFALVAFAAQLGLFGRQTALSRLALAIAAGVGGGLRFTPAVSARVER